MMSMTKCMKNMQVMMIMKKRKHMQTTMKRKKVHGHEEHEEAPYLPKVVEIIAYNGDDVAIKGLKAGEEYVSDGVYFVKSMILKSSLGEHGH